MYKKSIWRHCAILNLQRLREVWVKANKIASYWGMCVLKVTVAQDFSVQYFDNYKVWLTCDFQWDFHSSDKNRGCNSLFEGNSKSDEKTCHVTLKRLCSLGFLQNFLAALTGIRLCIDRISKACNPLLFSEVKHGYGVRFGGWESRKGIPLDLLVWRSSLWLCMTESEAGDEQSSIIERKLNIQMYRSLQISWQMRLMLCTNVEHQRLPVIHCP